jgi:hypothetical protein
MGNKITITESERKQIQEMYYDFDSPRGIGSRGNTFKDKLNTKTDFTGEKKKTTKSTEYIKKEKSEQQIELERLRERLIELRNLIPSKKKDLDRGYYGSTYDRDKDKWLPNFFNTKKRKELEKEYKSLVKEKEQVEMRIDAIDSEREQKIRGKKSNYFGF